MLIRWLAIFGGVVAAGSGGALAGQDEAKAPAGTARPLRPVVVEMFLSQACNQSPPAAELVDELSGRRDIVALTWHVDYWDALPAPGVGAWKDPFARPDFGARQMAYNSRIRGRAVKMTPQAVIDGVISVPGSARAAVERRIVEAQFLDEMARATPPTLRMIRGEDGMIRTRIENVSTPFDAVVVNFRPTTETRVAGGDNAGVVFRESNVVRAVAPIALGHSGPGDFAFAAPKPGLDCAVIVQERGRGRILAARYCRDAATGD